MITVPKRDNSTISEAKDRLIVALDVPDADEARLIVSELAGSVGAFKIGLRLFTSAGPDFVRELTSAGEKIFLDLKFHDIPNTVAAAAVEAARLGVWMFNLHALGGREMMLAARKAVDDLCEKEKIPRPILIAVTLLTSMNVPILEEVGIDPDIRGRVLHLATLAAECGLDGVVASAKEAQLLRNLSTADRFLIVTPGIRPSDATADDQKRVLTPAEAIRAGSNYLVIGRPIIGASNRRDAARRIVGEIDEALNG